MSIAWCTGLTNHNKCRRLHVAMYLHRQGREIPVRVKANALGQRSGRTQDSGLSAQSVDDTKPSSDLLSTSICNFRAQITSYCDQANCLPCLFGPA